MPNNSEGKCDRILTPAVSASYQQGYQPALEDFAIADTAWEDDLERMEEVA